ncbi:hypothetical protein NHX12_015203 [Muraenolepis orangiensis]|uniref:Uncharacterized protein n=1 Tax=Muraenolepis orangiensis TaxID=630683 RepID=A0A9Q0D9Z4_9TELE|nr:hypothetical protein NHX12_015203 [Muraenolepis orangiensis]
MVNGDFAKLTRKHGIKISAGFACTVEEIWLAVGEKVGHGSIKSLARMNSVVVIFLDQVEKVNCVFETGIAVREIFVQVQPLMLPATKVILSNVPPFITDEFLSRELSRHGKLVSPMKKMLSGCRSRRQNVHLVGIEEAIEGNNPRQFCVTVLKGILELEDIPRKDHGYRTLAPKPREEAQAVQVAKKRAAFADVKQLLQNIPDVKFGLRFPAKLRITFKGKEKYFEDPELAMSYVQNNIIPPP